MVFFRLAYGATLHLWCLVYFSELPRTRSAAIVPNVSVEIAASQGAPWQPQLALAVTYSEVLQPLVNVSVGGQWLQLVYDTSSAHAVAFMKEHFGR
eukprot:Skav209761  [mRNA]  locus=scaffold9:264429:270048:+ [translate_table: standard]